MKFNYFYIAITIVLLIAITGCTQPADNTDDNFTNLSNYSPIDVTIDNTTVNETENTTTEPEVPAIDESKASFTVKGKEGDLIKIPIDAVDPDGDFLEYAFGEPFNEKGLWQTNIGDEGKYLIKVSVSDGRLTTSEFVLIDVLRANRPPVIECEDEIEVSEGQEVVIDCNIYDVDGDVVIVGYDGWMKTASYTTTFGDAGEHTVIVRAKDKEHDSFKEVTINVKKTNRPPVINDLTDAEIMETETFSFQATATDADGDDVTIAYGEPLDENGEWTPTYGDRGTYTISVSASDDEDTTTQTFDLTVTKVNRVPVLKEIEPINVKEGEVIEIPVQAYDPDGDEVTILFDGWMDSRDYKTTYDDANPNGCDEKGCTAEYIVKVTATDGTLQASQDVIITVEDINRPPVFVFGN